MRCWKNSELKKELNTGMPIKPDFIQPVHTRYSGQLAKGKHQGYSSRGRGENL